MSFDANVNGENTPNTYYKEYVQVRILCRLCTCVQITRRGVVPIAEPFMRPQHVVSTVRYYSDSDSDHNGAGFCAISHT